MRSDDLYALPVSPNLQPKTPTVPLPIQPLRHSPVLHCDTCGAALPREWLIPIEPDHRICRTCWETYRATEETKREEIKDEEERRFRLAILTLQMRWMALAFLVWLSIGGLIWWLR